MDESTFIQHEPCPSCGSKDNLARYSDGHGFCFGCQHYEPGDGETPRSKARGPMTWEPVSVEYRALPKRGITEETCKKFGYGVGTFNDQPVQVAPFYDEEGALVAQHLRFPNKDFIWLGEPKKAVLWGEQLWRDGGKMVVVTEGEIDAMTISQLQGNRWPVVSIKSGAGGAKKDLAKSVEWLSKFESVVLAFDMDDVGKAAMQACAEVLPPGKTKVWNIPLKDANEMLIEGRTKEILDGVWGAKVYRPDGIVSAEDTWGLLVEEDKDGDVPYPWTGLNEKLLGMRRGELVTITAGSGIGKSQVCREIASHLIRYGETVGYIALEESVKRSVRGLVAIEVSRPIHLASVRAQVPEADLRAAWGRIKDRAYFYDHWGSMDADNLISRIRYLARSCECKWIVLDHLSIVVSGDGEGEERRKIDNLMTTLRSLVEELQIGLFLVSHLKGADSMKQAHEEGGHTHLQQLRGSRAIGQLSDAVIGCERNQQDPDHANRMLLRILKNRFTGETGPAVMLHYSRETGRLTEVGMEDLFDDETKTSTSQIHPKQEGQEGGSNSNNGASDF